jgi:glycosyltransferase involved in cell wall biosynthesis
MRDIKKVFIVWKAYQRRVEAFKRRLNVSPIYIHFDWEERTKVHKSVSYLFKLCITFFILIRQRPGLIYIQAPPTFLVYAAYLYCKIAGALYIVDAHNSMIHGSFWHKMPFTKYVLTRACVVIVHNEVMGEMAKNWGIPYTVLMCRPPEINPENYSYPRDIIGTRSRPRIVVPCSFDIDEPLDEMKKAILALPDVDFFITWYREKMPPQYVEGFGDNVVFTGFLPQEHFDSLLANADGILVLTTRDGTQPSGATEALAFHKPLVVSDFWVIRSLFPVGAIYVRNEARDIAQGIRVALEKKSKLGAEMAAFKEEKFRLWEQQFETLNRIIEGKRRRALNGKQQTGVLEDA